MVPELRWSMIQINTIGVADSFNCGSCLFAELCQCAVNLVHRRRILNIVAQSIDVFIFHIDL